MTIPVVAHLRNKEGADSRSMFSDGLGATEADVVQVRAVSDQVPTNGERVIASFDTPGVIARPPLLYLLALVVASLLHWYRPIPLGNLGFVRWLGAGLMLAGPIVILRARRSLLAAGTNIDPKLPTTVLVTSGMFGISRNPLYVALTLFFVGIALVASEGWGLVVLAPLLVVLHRYVVLREERYLERKFGAAYRSYRGTVRRYL